MSGKELTTWYFRLSYVNVEPFGMTLCVTVCFMLYRQIMMVNNVVVAIRLWTPLKATNQICHLRS